MPIQENQVGLYEPWQEIGPTWRPGVPSGVGCPETHTDCTWYSDGIKALRRTGYQRRTGVMGTLEFRPSNTWTSVFDVFHSQAVQEDTANQFEVHLGGYNGNYPPGLAVLNPVINDNDTFVGGTATGVYPLVRGMYNKREDTIDAFGWNNKFTTGAVQWDADISWSRSERDELNLENNTQLYPAPQLDSIDLDYTGTFPTLTPGRDYSNPDSLYLSNTIYGSGYGKTPHVEDELRSFRLNANFGGSDEGWFSSWDVGLNYADRQKDKRQPEGNINLGAQGPTAIGSQFQYGLVDLGFAGVGMIPSWDVPGVVAEYMTFEPNENAPWLISKAWGVSEQITSAWVRGNIDTDWGDVPVRGNIGVQVQRVDQSSTANVWDHTKPSGSEIVSFTNGKTYTDILPSLNLSFEIAPDQRLRFALARQVARPRVDQLRASLDFGVDTATGKPGAGGGNPLLDPWRANAFDVSWEKYFDGNKGYVAAAFFYKDLTTYIFSQTREGYDFSELVATYVPPPGAPPAQTTGTLNGPFNGKGGKLKGLELTASIPLGMWSDALEGFGFIANASFNDSNIKIRDPDSASSVGSGDISLPGLSDRVYNFTVYYEKNGWSARVNQRRRSDFIGEIGDFAANRKLRYVEGENITDAQLSYHFGGQEDGLTVLLQASNLTNSKYHTYAGTKDRPLETIEWGRTVLLGASYKF
jgi:iron complex outermembrane recepter protein